MDGVRLHRLGKRLIDLAREVTTSAGDASLTPAEVAVVEDVLPRYFAALEPAKPTAAAAKPPAVVVTLVRWPYT